MEIRSIFVISVSRSILLVIYVFHAGILEEKRASKPRKKALTERSFLSKFKGLNFLKFLPTAFVFDKTLSCGTVFDNLSDMSENSPIGFACVYNEKNSLDSIFDRAAISSGK